MPPKKPTAKKPAVIDPVAEVEPKYIVTLKDATPVSVNGSRPIKYPAGTYEVSFEVYTVLVNSGRIPKL